MQLTIKNKFKRYQRIVKTKVNSVLGRQETGSVKANHILFDEMFDINELRNPERHFLMENNLKLQREHYPQPCKVKAEVFRTQRQSLFSPHDPNMGWKELALNGVTCHVVPGSHRLLPSEPYAQKLSRLLSKRLNNSMMLLP